MKAAVATLTTIVVFAGGITLGGATPDTPRWLCQWIPYLQGCPIR